MIKKLSLIFTVLIFILLSISCTKDNSISLTTDYSIEGLQITFKGSAFIKEGTMSEVSINWGDGKSTSLKNINFNSFEKEHLYAKPSIYNITIIATDIEGASVSKSYSISMDYKEANLSKIKPTMFKSTDNEYLILTLNLHTYQESNQYEKFNTIVELIAKMDVDFITFQECAQHRSSTIVNGIIRKDNMALIITDKLKEKFDKEYSYVWDWAHYGWNVWEEGVAVLSKHPLVESDSRYISTNVSTSNITSRKTIYASYQMQSKSGVQIGKINFFSVHNHWRTSETDNEQNNQITNIQNMVTEKDSLNPSIVSFVCGDFNVNPTSSYPWSEGYFNMINNNEYIDSFLEIYSDANDIPAKSIYNTIGGTYPGRIDYIFMQNKPNVKIIDSQIIFNNDVVESVSDHNGVLTKISLE